MRWWRHQYHLQRLALHSLCIDFDWNMDNHQDHDPTHTNIYNVTKHHYSCVAPLESDLTYILKAIPGLWETMLHKEPRLGWDPIDERGGTYGRNNCYS